MIDFVGPERVQMRPQCLQGTIRATRIEPVDRLDLFGVVVVDEGLDGLDGGVHRPRPDPRRQRTGQPSGSAPQRQQPAAVARRQQRLDRGKVRRFRGEVLLRETADCRVARDGEDAAIDHHGSRFAGVVGAQVGHQPRWERTCLRRAGPCRKSRVDRLGHHGCASRSCSTSLPTALKPLRPLR